MFLYSFEIFINNFVHKGLSFPSFFRKILMSAFLLSSKANYLDKMPDYHHFSLRIPIALTKIYMYFFCMAVIWRKTLTFVFSRHRP